MKTYKSKFINWKIVFKITKISGVKILVIMILSWLNTKSNKLIKLIVYIMPHKYLMIKDILFMEELIAY